jgi:hypothetical protein
MVAKTHWLIPRSAGRYTAKQIDKAVTLKAYCKKHHLTESGARDRIARRKVAAFKQAGLWWIVDETR